MEQDLSKILTKESLINASSDSDARSKGLKIHYIYWNTEANLPKVRMS